MLLTQSGINRSRIPLALTLILFLIFIAYILLKFANLDRLGLIFLLELPSYMLHLYLLFE